VWLYRSPVLSELWPIHCLWVANSQMLRKLAIRHPQVREETIQDRRLSEAEAIARGDAFLASRPLNATSVTYTCWDLNTVPGKTITVNFRAPTNVSGTFRIQQVVWSSFRPYANQLPTDRHRERAVV
jgi:hypothetical protein